MYFSMVFTQGLGSSDLERQGIIDDEILRVITVEVAKTFREAIPEVFGYIKTMMIKLFDEHYVVFTEFVATATTTSVPTTRPHGGDLIQY